MGSGDHDIDFQCTCRNRIPDFLNPPWKRTESMGKTRRHRSHGNVGSLECFGSGFDQGMVNTYRTHSQIEGGDPKIVGQFLFQRSERFGTQTSNPVRGVIAGKRGQIHTANGFEQPCGLPLFLDTSSFRQTGTPSLNRAAVDLNRIHPVKIEGYSRISLI